MIKNQSQLGTLASKIVDNECFENQNIVKVVTKEKLNNSNFPEAKILQERSDKRRKILTTT